MDKSYDIIVVGAGPAGAMAAKCAAENGASTLLLEKHAQVGLPVCCAEGITTAGLERVIKPRPEWIASTIEGASLISPSGSRITLLHPKAGYVLDREQFDNGLAGMAVEAGAELLVSSPVVGIKSRRNGLIESVTIFHENERREISGRLIIAADGVESRVAHMAGIDSTVDADNISSACQYLADDIDIEPGIVSITIGNDIAPGGYAWVFPKSARQANIGVMVSPSRASGKTAKEYLDLFMASRFPHFKQVRTVMGTIPVFKRGMPLVKGNLMLVGDAARVLDSLTGAGISNALISGSIAGKTAAAWIGGKAALDDYPAEFWKLKKRELYSYRLFRSIYVKTSDAEFEDILKTLDSFYPEKNIRDVNVPDVIFRLIFRNPGLLKMARYLIAK